jgi:hypothetical protein
MDDRARYDRATRLQHIEDFKAWVASDGPKTEVKYEELGKVYGPHDPAWSKYFGTSHPARHEKRPGDPQYLDSPRYRFFIQADQEFLENVLAIDDPDEYMTSLGRAPYAGWVSIVNSRWPLYPTIALEEAYRPHPNDPEIEFNNGCCFRATPAYLYPYLFAALTSDLSDSEYLRPPRVVADCPGGVAPEYGNAVMLCTSRGHAEFGSYGQDRWLGIWWTNGGTCGDNEDEDEDVEEMDGDCNGE